jgi:predicted nucleic acid-binding protein
MSGNLNATSYFVDSNIWLYAFIQSQDVNKHAIANQLVQSGTIFISTQVINEVCINLIRKAAFSEQQIYSLVAAFYQMHTVIEPGIDIILKASDFRSKYLFSFWDSLIVATAIQAGADILISEDMQNGLIIEEKLEIKNPFL